MAIRYEDISSVAITILESSYCAALHAYLTGFDTLSLGMSITQYIHQSMISLVSRCTYITAAPCSFVMVISTALTCQTYS